jgi:hypothetical protein
MNEEQLVGARRFITYLLGEAVSENWWMSEKARESRHGKPLTGWFVTLEDER